MFNVEKVLLILGFLYISLYLIIIQLIKRSETMVNESIEIYQVDRFYLNDRNA